MFEQELYTKYPLFTEFVLFNLAGDIEKSYGYHSDIEKIGIERAEIAVKNGTYVKKISEPVEIDIPKYGKISVIKVLADIATDYHTIMAEFWAPTASVIETERLDKLKAFL
jgi:hypothetical protein